MIAAGGSLKMQHFLNKLMKQHTLGPMVMDLCELIKIKEPSKLDEIRMKQRKLSEVTDMIHAAHVFHRTVPNHGPDQGRIQDKDGVLSLLVGDYLLAKSSVDMASLRQPRTSGLIAQGLEDYTRGEFLKMDLVDRLKHRQNYSETQQVNNDIRRYAELTCGSLLSNACLSAIHLAGHDETDEIADVVHLFGYNTGSAQRLLEILNFPTGDEKCILETVGSGTFKQYIDIYVDKSVKSLYRLPDGQTRSRLVTMLEKMRRYLVKNT